MPIEQIFVLAIVQGISEFLPISSSGHLILIPFFTGWPDQGLDMDVMVHIGSLLAILVYFWRDVVQLVIGGIEIITRKETDRARMALYIILATIPAVIVGIILKKIGFEDMVRGPAIVAWNSIIFGVLMLIADRIGPLEKKMEDMTLKAAMFIGCAQALALDPGTSRSGITMTAARYLGFQRPDCARFSFLLGIPAIAGAGTLTVLEILDKGQGIPAQGIYAAALTFVAALITIAFLMALLRRISLLPFVLYRVALGGFLLVLVYGGSL